MFNSASWCSFLFNIVWLILLHRLHEPGTQLVELRGALGRTVGLRCRNGRFDSFAGIEGGKPRKETREPSEVVLTELCVFLFLRSKRKRARNEEFGILWDPRSTIILALFFLLFFSFFFSCFSLLIISSFRKLISQRLDHLRIQRIRIDSHSLNNTILGKEINVHYSPLEAPFEVMVELGRFAVDPERGRKSGGKKNHGEKKDHEEREERRERGEKWLGRLFFPYWILSLWTRWLLSRLH